MQILANINQLKNKAFPETGTKGSRGFALLVVIVVLLLTSFLASQLIMQVRTEQKIAFNVKNKAISRFLSEGGINLALFRLMKQKPLELVEGYEDFFHGHPYETYLKTGKISYYATNESGKIDLNKAPRRLLELFCEYHGLEEDQIETVVDSLLDWQDADDLHRLNGAELNVYEELDDPYIPRNGAMEDPAEFFLVNGTDLLAGKFEAGEVFTIHNAVGKINFNSLTPAMLDFLVEGDFDRKEAYREAQKLYEKFDKTMMRQILGDERYDEVKNFLTESSGNNQHYYISAYGQAGVRPGQDEDIENIEDIEEEERPKIPGIRIGVVVRIEGTIRHQFLSWKEKYS